jgi:hypothetical protein
MKVICYTINFIILLNFVNPQSVPNVCFCATSGNCNSGTGSGTGTGTDGTGLWLDFHYFNLGILQTIKNNQK